MTEPASLLHNMSAPPKSVVNYSGLSSLASQSGPGGTGVLGVKYTNPYQFGTALRFTLPDTFAVDSPLAMLAQLGLEHEEAVHGCALKHLQKLINERAAELPLPEGCAVIKARGDHSSPWGDPLATLAVLSKSTETVWLRGKTPTLSALRQRRSVSLLVPPSFAEQLTEKKR